MTTENGSEKPQPWLVYLLECFDGTTYIGATNNLERRLKEHNTGQGARYTRGRRPVRLLGSIPCVTRSDALKLEYRLKSLTPNARKLAFKEGIAN